MSTEQYLDDVIKRDGAAHLTLIDPDAGSPSAASEIAEAAAKAGSSAIMIGGSVGASGDVLDETLRAIKEVTDLPTILFPASASGISRYADSIFFMSLLNSRDVGYLITNQMIGAKAVLDYGIEPIPMAYIIVEPGGTAGWVGVPPEMIRAVKRAGCETLVVGGGIGSAQSARAAAEAGADIIVTGTAVEETSEMHRTITEFVNAIKK